LAALCHSAFAQGSLTYVVNLNTTPLVGHPAGPFYLFLEFIDGSGVGASNNTVTLNNLDLNGGNALGNPFSFGGVTGSLETGVTMTDTSFVNVFGEAFVPGNDLSFTLGLTSNGNANGIPDGFTLFILDSSSVPLPTLSPVANYFLTAALGSNGPVFTAYGSDPSRSPSVGNPISMSAPTVQLISRQTKTAAGAALLALLPTGRREVDDELREAIERVNASLTPALWSDDYHLTKEGSRVFEEEWRAVHDLERVDRLAPSLKTQLLSAENTLALVDRALAQTAISDALAAGKQGERLTKAEDEVTRGDDLASKGDYGAAIERYRRGWILVETP
jgi:hypothetical protein